MGACVVGAQSFAGILTVSVPGKSAKNHHIPITDLGSGAPGRMKLRTPMSLKLRFECIKLSAARLVGRRSSSVPRAAQPGPKEQDRSGRHATYPSTSNSGRHRCSPHYRIRDTTGINLVALNIWRSSLSVAKINENKNSKESEYSNKFYLMNI